MTLDSITFEDDKVVAFSSLDHLTKLMQIVVSRCKVEDLVIPYDSSLGCLEFNTLTHCVLEVQSELVSY